MSKTQQAPAVKVAINPAGQPRFYSCLATQHLPQLDVAAEEYARPVLLAIAERLKTEGSISKTDYMTLLRHYNVFRNSFTAQLNRDGFSGEQTFNAIIQEEMKLSEEVDKLEQELSGKKKGSGRIIWED